MSIEYFRYTQNIQRYLGYYSRNNTERSQPSPVKVRASQARDRGFKSRTSHFFMLDFGDLSTNLSTNSAFARKFVYKHQIFVYIGSYVCLQRISTAIPSLGSSYLNQAGLTSLPIMNITHDLKFEIIRFRFRHIDNNKKLQMDKINVLV